ncbi:MAG: glycosyltransferase family 4 protein [Spirochaetaceae bacterium]|nr:glycosyltransferase family 4 protein [Spirochaetaceae bacterium]MCF7950736.1 glycosyltransferase family 4 protein [Spirochaetaceae bacterium]
MIILIAPESRLVSGGYLYNRHIADSLPEEQFSYLLLPMKPGGRTHSRPPAPETLRRFGVPPEAHLLLDSLYFAHPQWVESLASWHSGPLSMLVHYLPSRDPLLPPSVAETRHRDEASCLSNCRSAVVPSHYLKTELQRLHPEAPPITVAPPGIAAIPEPDNSSAVNQPAVQLLTVANWTASKNHRFLLPVLAELSKLPWKWSIYGRADESRALVQEFQNVAQSYRIDSRIYIGPQLSPKEVVDKLHRADLFIYPSLFESYGMVIAEALAAGLPIVANRIGGIPEVVEASSLDGKASPGVIREAKGGTAAVLCNFASPRGSQQEWRTALTRLIKQPQERQNLGAAALERARNLPSWQATAEAILSHLEPK